MELSAKWWGCLEEIAAEKAAKEEAAKKAAEEKAAQEEAARAQKAAVDEVSPCLSARPSETLSDLPDTMALNIADASQPS